MASNRRTGGLAFGVFLACHCASALNPSLDISQYSHNAWTIRDGAFTGTIESIAQTSDGYLWLGTQFGLLRFDGARFVPWKPPVGMRLPGSDVSSLLAAHNGSLWIGTTGGLASWRDGRLNSYTELTGQVMSLLEDSEGTIWAGTQAVPTGRLCSIRSGVVRCFGQDGSLGRFVGPLREDGGYLWVATATGLWRWKPGPPRLYPIDVPERNDLTKDNAGRLLIATASGIVQLAGESVKRYPIGAGGRPLHAMRLLRDRDGGLWIGTLDRGLLHVHEGRTDFYSQLDGLSGNQVFRLFEDREGDIWVATNGGLDRFRNFPVPTVSAKEGLSSPPRSVLAASDGSLWIGTSDGLNCWQKPQITVYRPNGGPGQASIQSLFQDDHGQIWVTARGGLYRFEQSKLGRVSGVPGGYVWSMAGSADDLWISSVDQGLLHLREGHLVERISWAMLGRSDFASVLLHDPSTGGLWLGFIKGGILSFQDSQVRSFAEADGLAPGRVSHLRLDKDGALWAASSGGLSRIKDGRIATLTSKNGLPCDTVHWSIEGEDHFVWLYMACGLVRIATAELDAWVANPKHIVQTTVFEASDGVRLEPVPFSGYSPTVTKAADGRIWFVSGGGVSIIDPRHLEINKYPPPVHIEQIISDRETRWQNLWGAAASGLRLPALSRDLQIDYTALSLVAPEKNRFKYKLEGYDHDWVDAGNRQQAFYTNLPPRQYRFHVIACNNSGVWNHTGDTLEFSIAPAWNQTSWFYASCVAAFLAMLWGLYRLRLYQIRREFNAQLDGRVDERLRVARELHDTMLQSFQAALIQMQAARNIFTRRPEKTEESLDKAINTAAGAIAEGRSAIQDLRLHPAGGGDLAQLVTTAGQELARSEEASANPPAFGVTVEGARQELNPLLQDEVYRIARELLRNAFRHSQSARIEVEIRYERRQFRLHVRDDGKGIDADVLKAGGRSGHYGLPGMRERANRFGGKLEFWSEAGAGTEAVLTVPAAAAYSAANGGRFSFLRRKKARA